MNKTLSIIALSALSVASAGVAGFFGAPLTLSLAQPEHECGRLGLVVSIAVRNSTNMPAHACAHYNVRTRNYTLDNIPLQDFLQPNNVTAGTWTPAPPAPPAPVSPPAPETTPAPVPEPVPTPVPTPVPAPVPIETQTESNPQINSKPQTESK